MKKNLTWLAMIFTNKCALSLHENTIFYSARVKYYHSHQPMKGPIFVPTLHKIVQVFIENKSVCHLLGVRVSLGKVLSVLFSETKVTPVYFH